MSHDQWLSSDALLSFIDSLEDKFVIGSEYDIDLFKQSDTNDIIEISDLGDFIKITIQLNKAI